MAAAGDVDAGRVAVAAVAAVVGHVVGGVQAKFRAIVASAGTRSDRRRRPRRPWDDMPLVPPVSEEIPEAAGLRSEVSVAVPSRSRRSTHAVGLNTGPSSVLRLIGYSVLCSDVAPRPATSPAGRPISCHGAL